MENIFGLLVTCIALIFSFVMSTVVPIALFLVAALVALAVIAAAIILTIVLVKRSKKKKAALAKAVDNAAEVAEPESTESTAE